MSFQKATQTPEVQTETMCQAHECPNRWTVDNGKRLCSAHAWANFRDWDRITQREWAAYRQRGDKNNYEAMSMEVKVPARKVSETEKRQIIGNLRDLMQGKRHA